MGNKRKEGPLSIDWCDLIDPSCPFQIGHKPACGIKQWLRGFAVESRQEKRDWLKKIAQEDRDRFIRICQSGIFDQP